MPRVPWSVFPNGLPRGVKPSESAPSASDVIDAGMSTRIQWKKSARSKSYGIVRSVLLASSLRAGASGSTHTMANDWVPAGKSDQARCGLLLGPGTGPAPDKIPIALREGTEL